MPKFADSRDMSTLLGFNDELMRDVISQQVGYRKISLKTTSNIYGESTNKQYEIPRLLFCQVMSSSQQALYRGGMTDVNRQIIVVFLQAHLEENEVFIESGDVLEWHDQFFEISNVSRNTLPFDLDPNYAFSEETADFGASWNVIVEATVTSKQKLGL